MRKYLLLAALLVCGTPAISSADTNDSASVLPKIVFTKKHETTIIALVNLNDCKVAVLEFRDWFPKNNDSMTSRQTVREGQRFEDQQVKYAHVTIEIVKINFADGSIVAREDGAEVVYRFQSAENGDLKAASLRVSDQNMDGVLDLYAEWSGRTLLVHPAVNNQTRVVVAVNPHNKAEALKSLEGVLNAKGFAVIPDGEKFEQVIPIALIGNANPHSANLAGSKSDASDAGIVFNFKNVPFNQFCDFYAACSGRKIVREGIFYPVSFSLQSRNSLTKPELIYALDVLLAWQGIKIANVDEKTDKALITDKNILLANSNRDGQDKSLPILLTSKDVDTNSVRVTTSPASAQQNLVFKFVHKNSAEIKAMAKRRPRSQVKVMKNGVVIAETTERGFSGYAQIVDGQTNFIGLTLIFSNYDQAKLAEKALRGD